MCVCGGVKVDKRIMRLGGGGGSYKMTEITEGGMYSFYFFIYLFIYLFINFFIFLFGGGGGYVIRRNITTWGGGVPVVLELI